MRVERFAFKSARTVRLHAPWAKRIVRIGRLWVAYERAEDADDEHGKMYSRESNVPASRDWKNFTGLYGPATIVRAARRRGENA